jgi:hypothetical protein
MKNGKSYNHCCPRFGPRKSELAPSIGAIES